MKFGNPKIWVGALSAVGVVAFASLYTQRQAPGPVTAVHAGVEALNGGNNCSACHGGWTSNMTESCLECHEAVAKDIETGHGLHGRVGETVALCARCHSEHHGAEFSIVNRASYAGAGTVGPEGFDHAFVGFEMAGKHLELDCEKCHTNADVAVLPEGQHRFLGLDQNCATCHEDSHRGQMVVSCVSCHGQHDFKKLESFGHDEHLDLVGGHADVDCKSCHQDATPHSLDSLGRGRRVTPRSCADCHESPHAREFVAGNARAAGESEGNSCTVCHLPDHTSFRDERLELTAAQHGHSGFRLGEPHHEVDCAKCHEPAPQRPFGERYPGREADNCAACHDDPHGGQFANGPFDSGPLAGVGCIACHERTHFEPHGFTREHHAKTGLPLTGAHAELDCRLCHQDPEPDQPRKFAGTPSRCDACHTDAHDGFFGTLPSKPLAEIDASTGTCAHCHTTESFSRLPDSDFDHARWTGFPIRGAHAQSDCTSCHPRAIEPDHAGRTFGRVAEHFGEYHGCVTCHEDIHRGLFDGKRMPAEIEGRRDCARCHAEVSFRTLPHGFDHRLWTGFALHGKHGEIGCSACHKPLRRPDAHGRTWAAAKGNKCADCHADPHAGQFHVGGKVDCARCHNSYTSFDDLAFEHDRHSRFKLGEAHAEVACAACHKPTTIGTAKVVRYRPLPRNCVDCHGSVQDPLRRKRRK